MEQQSASKKEASPDSPVRLASNSDGLSDNGLAGADDNTEQKRFRRPGPWSVVPNFVLTTRRLRGLSATARALNIYGWIAANANRTDGEITGEDLAGISTAMAITLAQAHSAAVELVASGLWTEGYRVVDFLKWSHSRHDIERMQDEGQKRAKAWRDFKKGSDTSKEKEGNREQQKATGTYGVRTEYVYGKDGQPKGVGEPE